MTGGFRENRAPKAAKIAGIDRTPSALPLVGGGLPFAPHTGAEEAPGWLRKQTGRIRTAREL